jgi:predicted DNA-binding protein with PD1-like motif
MDRRMKHREIEKSASGRVFLLVLEAGEDPLARLTAFAEANDIRGAHVAGIGAFSRAEVAFWRPETKEYEPIAVAEQVEVLALSGNISRLDGKPRVHAHVVLGKPDGSTVGGHLLNASVLPTLELFVTVWPGELTRSVDAATGLPLLAL